MFRTSLVLLLSFPLIQGFGVVVRPAFYQPATAALFANTDPLFQEDEILDDSVIEEDSFTSIIKQPYFIGSLEKEEPVSKKEQLSAKAQAAMSDISAKAQEFANDPKVKEISEKASAFTKDFVGNIMSSVGDKLKEMKREKEERQMKKWAVYCHTKDGQQHCGTSEAKRTWHTIDRARI